jgi:hypothetical protein
LLLREERVVQRVKPIMGVEFDEDARELAEIEKRFASCPHTEWTWLDCDECRETIGLCGEKICAECGISIE